MTLWPVPTSQRWEGSGAARSEANSFPSNALLTQQLRPESGQAVSQHFPALVALQEEQEQELQVQLHETAQPGNVLLQQGLEIRKTRRK